MTSTLYHLYQKKTLELIDSLIIKSQFTADAMNRNLAEYGLTVDKTKPNTWRYYLHLAGEKHLDSDQSIKIISHDTLSEIEFTKDNLAIHKGTYLNYITDKQYVDALYDKYPEQTNYIRGVLYPVDIEKAIASEEGTILYCNSSLIETNEYSLVNDLQDSIYRIIKRWNVTDYRIIDDLYPATFYAVLFASLPAVLMNLRLDRCKTPEANTYHIKEYLASNGGIDKYIDALTIEQVLWLYRNIKYIVDNAGKESTLNLLIENILTKLNIPVSHYVIEHNVQDMPDSLYPKADFIKIPLNSKRIQDLDVGFGVAEILVKERDIAPENIKVEAEYSVKINDSIEVAAANTLPTKILESSMIDYGEYSPYTFSQTLLNHWGYLASQTPSRYSAYINITVGSEKLNMKANDAWVFFIYALHKAFGIELPRVPRSIAHNVRKLTQPTYNDLRRLAPFRYITDGEINRSLSDIPEIGSYVSTIGFREGMLAVHKRLKAHRLEYTTTQNFISRGMLKGINMSIYPSVEYSSTADMSYTNWFTSKSIPIANMVYTAKEWETIYIDVAKQAIGETNPTKKTLAYIQKACIELVKQLSSYTVQWIHNINEEQLVLSENPLNRLDNVTLSGSALGKTKLMNDVIGSFVGYTSTAKSSLRQRSTVALEPLEYVSKVNYSSVLSHSASLVSGHFVSHGLSNFYISEAAPVTPGGGGDENEFGAPESESESETEIELEDLSAYTGTLYALGVNYDDLVVQQVDVVNLFEFSMRKL